MYDFLKKHLLGPSNCQLEMLCKCTTRSWSHSCHCSFPLSDAITLGKGLVISLNLTQNVLTLSEGR